MKLMNSGCNNQINVGEREGRNKREDAGTLFISYRLKKILYKFNFVSRYIINNRESIAIIAVVTSRDKFIAKSTSRYNHLRATSYNISNKQSSLYIYKNINCLQKYYLSYIN